MIIQDDIGLRLKNGKLHKIVFIQGSNQWPFIKNKTKKTPTFFNREEYIYDSYNRFFHFYFILKDD